MYLRIKFGKHTFTLGNDRKGKDRRSEDAPVEKDRRKSHDRRREEQLPGGSQGKEEGEDGSSG